MLGGREGRDEVGVENFKIIVPDREVVKELADRVPDSVVSETTFALNMTSVWKSMCRIPFHAFARKAR